MRLTPLTHACLFTLGALAPLLAQGQERSDARVGLSPHVYLGERGTEPTFQTTFDFAHELSEAGVWDLRWHFDAETLGRHDLSMDLDRAWYRSGQWTFGRIHPWDVSGNPEADRPWGYLAQAQSQNRGIVLGEPARDHGVFPSPVVMGWVGVHFFSDPRQEAPFAFGFSATPLFVPSLGSEVSFTEDSDASAGRFGRRPPGTVLVNGTTLPLRYQIDRSRLVQDVLLQPQFAAQASWRAGLLEKLWRGWVTVMRAPSPDPTLDASGVVRVTGTGLDALAEVHPKFPERWLASLNQDWGDEALGVFQSLQWQTGGIVGYEIGARLAFLRASFIDQGQTTPSLSTDQPTADLYSSRLVQLEASPKIAGWRPYAGLKHHFETTSSWLRGGIASPSFGHLAVDAGVDLFSGDENSYFGEWRTNDRIYLVLRWSLT